MNCFMSYNPNVAHEVKVTTWIKEFDGASPVYPSFPNEGDVFIVFDNDEATEPSVNKTYTNGDWADTSSGDAPTGTIYITENGEGIDVSSYAYADVNVSGGGGLDVEPVTATIQTTPDYAFLGINASYNDLLAIINDGKIPCIELSDAEVEGLNESGDVFTNTLILIRLDAYEGYYTALFACVSVVTEGTTNGMVYFGAESADIDMLAT